MNDTDKKLLTEYLGECWHEDSGIHWFAPIGYKGDSIECKLCGQVYSINALRTFDTEADMMALYRGMVEKEEWSSFHKLVNRIWHYNLTEFPEAGNYVAWLFCLSGTGYEERCQMVADFLKSKGEKQQ